MAVVHPRLTSDEFEALFNGTSDEPTFELLDGQVVMVPPPGGRHSVTHFAVIRALHEWQRTSGDAGLVLGEVRMPVAEDVVGPDVAYWTEARIPAINDGAVRGTPDLVVEVLSPSNAANDRGRKRRSYLVAGVRELWLIDPRSGETIVVGENGTDRRLTAEDTLTSSLLPGFAVAIRDLLAP